MKHGMIKTFGIAAIGAAFAFAGASSASAIGPTDTLGALQGAQGAAGGPVASPQQALGQSMLQGLQQIQAGPAGLAPQAAPQGESSAPAGQGSTQQAPAATGGVLGGMPAGLPFGA